MGSHTQTPRLAGLAAALGLGAAVASGHGIAVAAPTGSDMQGPGSSHAGSAASNTTGPGSSSGSSVTTHTSASTPRTHTNTPGTTSTPGTPLVSPSSLGETPSAAPPPGAAASQIGTKGATSRTANPSAAPSATTAGTYPHVSGAPSGGVATLATTTQHGGTTSGPAVTTPLLDVATIGHTLTGAPTVATTSTPTAAVISTPSVRTPAHVTPSSPIAAAIAPVGAVVSDVLSAVGLGPVLDPRPTTPPAAPPTLWTMLAFTRREIQTPTSPQTPAADLTQTSQTSSDTTTPAPLKQTTATTAPIIKDALNAATTTNTAPVITGITVGKPVTSTGKVTGAVTAVDADGDTVTYTLAGKPVVGNVTVNSKTGAFTYTTTQAARLKAGLGTGPTVDAFSVLASDGQGEAAVANVVVPVAPAKLTASSAADKSFDSATKLEGTLVSFAAVAENPNGAALFVTMPTGKELREINPTTGKTIKTYQFPGGLAGPVVATKGYVFTATNNGVDATNLSTGKSTALKLSSVPGLKNVQLAVSPNGQWLYVAGNSTTSPNEEAVFVYERTANGWQEHSDSLLSGNPETPEAIAATNTNAYLVSSGGTLSIATPSGTGSSTSPALGGVTASGGVAVIGKNIYITESNLGEVLVVEPGGTTTIGVGADPSGIAVSPDGSLAYVTNAGDRTVSVIDTRTNTVISTLQVPDPFDSATVPSFTIGSIALSPSGNQIYVTATGTNSGGQSVASDVELISYVPEA